MSNSIFAPKQMSFQAYPLSALAMFEIAKRGKHRAIVNTAAASALGKMILRLAKRYHIPVIHVVRRQAQVDVFANTGASMC